MTHEEMVNSSVQLSLHVNRAPTFPCTCLGRDTAETIEHDPDIKLFKGKKFFICNFHFDFVYLLSLCNLSSILLEVLLFIF